jgi:hypothetical protein
MKKHCKGIAFSILVSLGVICASKSQAEDSLYYPKIGKFVSVKPGPQVPTLVLPSTHTFQLLAKTGVTPYVGGGTMASNNDFTAYVGNAGSSTAGIISVNQENTPGGVSLLDVNLNEPTMTWNLAQMRKVNFAPVASTIRNCSGGITPWATVITSEENTSAGDANLDGYQDIGWQVEIDPISGVIRDQNGDGTPDKLWALGRMNHENICISANGMTAYEAEDGGTSCVYKFVAASYGSLAIGDLYVLHRDGPTATTGIWVKVPNTTQADRNNVNTVAGSLGGTNWSGPEDIEFGPDGKMYFTSKGTGTIWRFKDDGMTVSQIEAWVTNRAYPITYDNGVANENFGTGIDNLVFDGEGNLWAQQDGGRNHLWVIRPDHTQANPKVELFATIPSGAEPTGLTFSPDYRYGFISIQHPNSTNAIIVKDAANNDVRFNAASTIVFSRREYLGPLAIEPKFELGADQIICEGTSTTLTAYSGSDATVKWTSEVLPDTVEGAELVVKNAGMYYAIAYGDNGRRWSDSVNIEVDAPAVYLGYKIPLCNTCTTTLDAGDGFASYLWSDNSTGQTLTVDEVGTYSVMVTTANGCTAADTVEVIQKNGEGNDLVPEQMIDIYPNPFETSTTIKLEVPEEAYIKLEVHTTSGKKVEILQDGTLGIGDHYFQFTPSGNLKNGVYIVQLIVNNQKVSQMVKQK